MIGMINIPNDSPAEFYASRHYHDYEEDPTSSTIEYGMDDDTKSQKSFKRPNSFLNLFNRRKNRQQVTYLRDGRKLYDGQVDLAAAPKLWEQLIVRTFVHKIEDEIQSPADQLNTIQEAFPTLANSKKSLSSSTYSLVSQDRVKSQCNKCCPQKLMTNLKKCSKLSKSSCKLQNVNNSPVTEHRHHHQDGSLKIESLSPADVNAKKSSLSPSARIIRRLSPRNSETLP